MRAIRADCVAHRAHDLAHAEYLVTRYVFGKFAHVFVYRVGDDFLRRTDLHHHAVLHDRDVVAHLDRLEKIVGDEDHRLVHLGLDIEQFVLHLPANQWIQGAERFVENQDFRIDRHRPRQADALLHAAREFARIMVRPTLQANLVQYFHRPGLAFFFVHAANLEPE